MLIGSLIGIIVLISTLVIPILTIWALYLSIKALNKYLQS